MRSSRSSSITSSGSWASSQAAQSAPPPQPFLSRVVGPTLPPGFRRSSSSADASASSDDDAVDVGPAPPSASELSVDKDAVSAATRLFLEREQRRNQAAMEAEAASKRAATTRPEWMLNLPTATSSLTSIAADPTRLKSRGFAQTTARVQTGRGAAAADGPADASLWSETPEERKQRLQDEISGTRARAGDAPLDEEEQLQRLIQERRDATIQAQLDKASNRRSTTLMDMHKDKRKRELRDREDGRERQSRSRRAAGDLYDKSDEENRDRRKSSRRRRRSRSRSPTSRRRGETSHHDPRDRSRRRPSDGDRHGERSRDRHSERSGDRDRRHRDEACESDEDSDARRRRRRREKEKRREERERDSDASKDRKKGSSKGKEQDRNRKNDEAALKKVLGTTAPHMWDRDAALNAGGKLMDEKSRGRLVQDAAALGSRFGSGSSRFL